MIWQRWSHGIAQMQRFISFFSIAALKSPKNNHKAIQTFLSKQSHGLLFCFLCCIFMFEKYVHFIDSRISMAKYEKCVAQLQCLKSPVMFYFLQSKLIKNFSCNFVRSFQNEWREVTENVNRDCCLWFSSKKVNNEWRLTYIIAILVAYFFNWGQIKDAKITNLDWN